MARPKGKLLALVLVFGAITVVTATGAFTTVEAERTAEVNVAGDSSALLGLGPTSDYAEYNNNQLELKISNGAENGADGINQNAKTVINFAFNVSNNGADNVDVSIVPNGSHAEHATFYNGSVGGDNITGTSSSPQANSVEVNSGNTIEVSLEIDLTGATVGDGDDVLSDITIHAESTESQA